MDAIAPSPTPKLRRKRRWVRGMLWTGVALIAFWIGALQLATWELHRASKALKNRGEPATFAEALALNETRTASPNGAELLLQAIREHDRLGNPGLIVSNITGDLSRPVDSDYIAKVTPWIKKGEPVVDLLERAVALPPGPLTPPSDTGKLAQIRRDPLPFDVRGLAWLLYFDARVSARLGDSRRSFRRLKTLYLLSEQVKLEAFYIPQLVRISILGSSDDAGRFVLPFAEFSPDELLELSELAARLSREFKMAPALVNQRAMAASIVQDSEALDEELQWELQYRTRSPSLTEHAFQFVERRWANLVSSPLGLPARRRAAAQTLRIPNDVLELADVPPPWSKEAQQRFDHWRDCLNAERVGLSPEPGDTMSNAFRAAVRVRRRLAMSQVAYRLRRFDILNGKLPDRLEELCDASMSTLPTKWFEEKPFVYVKNGHSFTLRADPSIIPEYVAIHDSQRENQGNLYRFDADAGKPATGKAKK
jgi:hypothetical protein